MLEKIQFINYKCFENATIPLRDITIAVGKNNAGKSTMIEGLRLLSLAIKSGSKQTYKDLPSIFQQRNKKSKKLKLDSLKIDLRTVSHFYKEDIISKIIGYFNDKNKIEIYISDDVAYACYYDKWGRNIKSANKFLASTFSRVEILPQIGLIKEEERQLAGSTIVNGRDTYLSSRHFRNEILDEKTKDITVYEEFCQLAEQTWQGLKVKELIAPSRGFTGDSTPPIQLMIEADRFTSEIGYMGSGLQMWLQIIWFICKSANSETVILDEPDVYMHPDLQRSLVKIVKNRFKQVIIASHSVEILSEVNPENVLMIDKSKQTMKFSSDIISVQNTLENLGSSQNITLLRIANTKKCIFVENSSDLKILNKIYEKYYPENNDSLLTLPFVELKGASNLPQAFGLSKLLASETKGNIQVNCILDRDYFPQDWLDKKLSEAKDAGLNLKFWNKKEIENYLIMPKVLHSISNMKDENKFNECLNKKIDEYFKDKVADLLASKLKDINRNWDISRLNSEARQIRDESWDTLEAKLAIIGGKEALKMIRDWFQKDFQTSCSIDDIIKNSSTEDFDNEIFDTIKWLRE